MASSDLKKEVSASTRNSPGAPAESPVERATVRKTGRPPQRTQPKIEAGETRQGQPHCGAPNGYCNGSSNVEDTLIYFVSKFIVDYAFFL